MAQRTPQEQQLLEKATRYLPGGTGGNMQVREDLAFLAREGKGSHIWDVSGKRIHRLDHGFGAYALGACPSGGYRSQ